MPEAIAMIEWQDPESFKRLETIHCHFQDHVMGAAHLSPLYCRY